MTKYCKDCRHCEKHSSYWCKAPQLGYSVVSGEVMVQFCSITRANGCGEEGKWFEPKESNKKLKSMWEFWG